MIANLSFAFFIITAHFPQLLFQQAIGKEFEPYITILERRHATLEEKGVLPSPLSGPRAMVHGERADAAIGTAVGIDALITQGSGVGRLRPSGRSAIWDDDLGRHDSCGLQGLPRDAPVIALSQSQIAVDH